VACVRAASGQALEQPYTLSVRAFTPDSPFEFEPNDDQEHASALPRGASLGGYLPAGDVDWYQLSAAPGKLAQLTATPPAGVALRMVVHDPAGLAVGQATGQPGEPVSLEHRRAAWLEVGLAEGSPPCDRLRYRVTTAEVAE
jgi:hypothetical protein